MRPSCTLCLSRFSAELCFGVRTWLQLRPERLKVPARSRISLLIHPSEQAWMLVSSENHSCRRWGSWISFGAEHRRMQTKVDYQRMVTSGVSTKVLVWSTRSSENIRRRVLAVAKDVRLTVLGPWSSLAELCWLLFLQRLAHHGDWCPLSRSA